MKCVRTCEDTGLALVRDLASLKKTFLSGGLDWTLIDTAKIVWPNGPTAYNILQQ